MVISVHRGSRRRSNNKHVCQINFNHFRFELSSQPGGFGFVRRGAP
jgi:hypothetical protein